MGLRDMGVGDVGLGDVELGDVELRDVQIASPELPYLTNSSVCYNTYDRRKRLNSHCQNERQN